MKRNNILTDLKNEFARLYPHQDDSRTLIRDAGLSEEHFAFKDKATTNWSEILQEAQRQGHVLTIINEALETYTSNIILQNAKKILEQNRDPSSGTDAKPSSTPFPFNSPVIGNPLQNMSSKPIILTILAIILTVSVTITVVKLLPASPSLGTTHTVSTTSTAATTASATLTPSSLQTIKLNRVMESANTHQLEIRGDSITFDIPHQQAEFDFTVTNKGYYSSSCSFSIDNDLTTYLHEGSTDNKYPLLAGTTWSNSSTVPPLKKFITFGNLSQSPKASYELNISIVIANCDSKNGPNTYSEIFAV